MALRTMLKGSKKAQFMTLIALLTFVLMLATLFAYALLNINNDNALQSIDLSTSANNYGAILKTSASSFAYASATKALQTLTNYEYNPSLRRGNFVTNLDQYLSYLMTNGMMPNDVSGYSQNAMGNMTFARYNQSISKIVGLSARIISINESTPFIYQSSPYALQISYVENIALSASYSTYRFSIPVNITLSLNNTPDLFLAQRGELRNIKFQSLNNITSVIGGAYATSGNSVGFAYGTVYVVPSSSGSAATCPLRCRPRSRESAAR